MKLRNAIGASKKEMISQLLLEYSLMIFIATLFAWSLMEITFPLFKYIFHTTIDSKELYVDMIKISLFSWIITLSISLPISFRFIQTSQLLVSGGVAPHRKSGFRKIAMTIQLGICVFFLMCAFILLKQTSLMKNKNLGFEKEGLIQITMLNDDREGTAREIASLPIVKELVVASFFSIMHEPYSLTEVEWEGKSPDTKVNFHMLEVGKNFLSAFQIPLLKGRLLEETDLVKGPRHFMSSKALINEEAARIMGYTDPIGKKLSFWNNQQQDVEIVGIVKDFQSTSLRNPILPVVITLNPSLWNSYFYYVKVNPGNEQKAIKAVRDAYKKYALPYDQQPEITTVNDVLKELSRSEDASLQLLIAGNTLHTHLGLRTILRILQQYHPTAERSSHPESDGGILPNDHRYVYSRICIYCNSSQFDCFAFSLAIHARMAGTIPIPYQYQCMDVSDHPVIHKHTDHLHCSLPNFKSSKSESGCIDKI